MENNSQDQETNVDPIDDPPELSTASLALLALRDKIRQENANKLKAEKLVSTLTRKLTREEIAKRRLEDIKKDVKSNQPAKRIGTNAPSILKEKSNLLKKKLEEDRAKLESKRGQEDLGKVSEIVEHIRVQLEDQEKTIQQLHSNFAATTKPTAPVEEIIEREIDVPQEVKQRISELEMKILDLQENLREKDSVISARTQAITLLSEDMARKGKNTLDTLEETRSQMKIMQANFVALEDRMNEEKVRLKEELENKKTKLVQIEKNYRAAESARFDLSTRVAELQEKVVALQTKNLSLEEENIQSDIKKKELTESLENSNKHIIKMKAQFKAKLKALEEERDMLRKEDKTSEEINRLREHIADLEDEKEAGNLLKERIAEMEEKLTRQECDLDSHVKAIKLLEVEKLDLLEAVNKKTDSLKEKEEMLQSLQKQVNNIEQEKHAVEIKCLELEEKLEKFMKAETDHKKLQSELSNANKQLLKHQEIIKELIMKLKDRVTNISWDHIQNTECFDNVKDIQNLSSSLEEWNYCFSLLDEKLSTTLSQCEELENKNKYLQNENEKLVKDCNQLKENVKNLNILLSSKPALSDSIVRQSLLEKENELVLISNQNKTLEVEVENLRHSLQSTTAQVHDLYQQLEEYTNTRKKVDELSAIIDSKDKELEYTVNTLDERSRKLSEYKKFHKLKSEDVLRISQELETVSIGSQQRISELEVALANSQKVEEDLKNELKGLRENLSSEPGLVDKKLQEQALKMKKIAASLKLKTKLLKDQEVKIEELQNHVHQNEILISTLQLEKASLEKQLVDNNQPAIEFPLSSISCGDEYKNLEFEVASLKEELKKRNEELEFLKNSSSEKYESILQIKELENQYKKLNDISETKSDQLRKMENELVDLNVINKSLLSELEQMQETYKQDALKNESVLDGFEHEMLGNKKDILELSNQLKDVTIKYEQAWAKLQEKEGYIEDLEQQLEKVKFRLHQIETTVEERRRSLEDKAELLGARLCQAEKNNEQLEKHEGELEHKIASLLNTEEMLSNILEKLQQENIEISKSLGEYAEKNIELSNNLESERNKNDNLSLDIKQLKTNLQYQDEFNENCESLKTQLKECQEAGQKRITYLESYLAEMEQCMENEIKRLSEKNIALENERQEITEKFKSVLLEKNALEEEYNNLQVTVLDITTTEIEQLKNNHENLSEQLNEELRKRETLIQRIKELESLLLTQNSTSESIKTSNLEEISALKEQLDNVQKEKESFKYELLKEKAKKQVDYVVSKAEETYFTMMAPSEIANKNSSLLAANLDSVRQNDNCSGIEYVNCNNKFHLDEIKELKEKISTLNLENTRLNACLKSLNESNKSVCDNASGVPETDDWTTLSKDEDDGWGWGSNDAMLDHEYIQKQKVRSELEEKVSDLENKLDNCKGENTILLEELKAVQLKCSKLLKKVKEFKVKSESLERNSREKSVGFDDLDFAMQEELRAQVDKLEKNLKECNSNLSLLQTERENLLKRIDTLTAGNERLVEMKERQDIEVEMWQRRANELQNKVQSLEWSVAELQAENNDQKIVGPNALEEKQIFLANALEMEEKLNILAAENEYLQSLIVGLKDQNKAHSNIAFKHAEQDVNTHEKIDYSVYLQLQQENHQLNELTKLLGEKLNIEYENITAENVSEYLRKIEELLSENEQLSYTLEKMVKESESKQLQTINKDNDDKKVENKKLTSTPSNLNEQLNLNLKSENLFDKKSSSDPNIVQLQEESVQLNISSLSQNKSLDNFNYISESNQIESPILFKGFTSVNNEFFDKTQQNTVSNIVSNENVFDQALMNNNSSADFFDTITLESEKCDVNQQSNVSNLEPEKADSLTEKCTFKDYDVEISDLKTLLCAKDTEINDLKEKSSKFEKDYKGLMAQLNDQKRTQSVEWNPFSDITSEDSAGWDSELLKKLEEKDSVIKNLKQLLNKTNLCFSSDNQLDELTYDENISTSLQTNESCQQNQIKSFVDQIAQMNNAIQEKDIEINSLREKIKKYKELFYTQDNGNHLIPSCSDEDQLTNQNIMLNQLLEDKETELEIMSQQMEQSKVAKDNLQDELSMTLSEIEAVNIPFAIPEMPKNVLLPPSQPENIEEVKTLCAEVEELTKLLQEKESEVEILKQQIDELNLEKENLIDEWRKKIEEYKDNAMKSEAKANKMELELENLKTTIVSEIEKQYKDDLSLKEQQLMNLMNDLHNTQSNCQDLQSKLCLLEKNQESSSLKNKQLVEELNTNKSILDKIEELTQYIDFDRAVNLSDKVEILKNKLSEIEQKFNEAKLEIKLKEDVISDLKQKLEDFGSVSNINYSTPLEEPVVMKQVKTFTSEPFRISTELSSSDDDSSSKYVETNHGPVLVMKEIQSLKQVLAMKDAEITRMSIALNEAQENLIKGELRFINSEEESLRHRLDEALYTLHLRDVRCDELALELMQLLEERDSLQLRLSTAIRFNEELRRKSQLLDEAAIKMESETNVSPPKKEDETSDERLKEKLDQLHNVGYRRDPGLQQEQQKRHQEHMQLYTQPAQEEPQQSQGFFNWIFGGSSTSSQNA